MKKRILSVLLAAVMVMGVIPFALIGAVAAETATAGDGNVYDTTDPTLLVADPDWYVADATDLYIWDESDFLAYGANMLGANDNYSGKVIHIMADLDYNAADGTNFAWPNAYDGRTFKGIVDGHNHTIKGLTYSPKANQYAGFFAGRVKPGTVNNDYGAYSGVFNVRMEDCEIIAISGNVGIIAGRIDNDNNITMKNLYVDAKLSGSGNTFGGIVGWDCGTASTFENCIFAGEINTTSAARVGGITAWIQMGLANAGSDTVIKDCAVTGKIIAKYEAIADDPATADKDETAAAGADRTVGGIVGQVSATGGTGGAQGRPAVVSVYFTNFFGEIETNAEYVGGAAARLFDMTTATEEPDVKGDLSVTYSNIMGKMTVTGDYTTRGSIVGGGKSHKVTITDTVYDGALLGGKIVAEGVTVDKQEDNAAVTGAKTAYAGYQTNAVADGKVDVRFLGTVDSLNYKEVGFDITYVVGKYQKPKITTVYSSILGDKTYTAADLGGNHIMNVTFEDIAVDGSVVSFAVKTYHLEDGNKVIDDVALVLVDTAKLG